MRLSIAAALLVAAGTALAGCDSPTFRFDPLLVADTVTLALPAPGDTLGSALDVTPAGALIGFVRHPELTADAGQWDVTIRERDGRLAFVPAGMLGITDASGDSSRAGVTHPLAKSFDEVIEAPGRGSFVRDSAVVIEQGAVYVVSSRTTAGSFGSGCVEFAKVQPLAVDVEAGRVELSLVANQNCSDPRLAMTD
ncbi:MAG TPA: hypothetical protein VFI96_07345 [Longimicrobiaceae bacterium]|nr:hypothetical protein [Longimicrobiaceae bacterium]